MSRAGDKNQSVAVDEIVALLSQIRTGNLAGHLRSSIGAETLQPIVDEVNALAQHLRAQAQAQKATWLQEFIDETPGMIAYWDVNLKNQTMNWEFARCLGSSPKDLVGIGLEEMLGPDQFELVRPQVFATLSGQPQNFLSSAAMPDGSIRYYSQIFRPDIHDGKVQGFFAIAFDTTEQENLKLRVKNSEQDIINFFNISSELICLTGTDGTFKSFNPAFTRVLGYSSEDLLSKPFIDFIHPEDILATQKEVEKLSQGQSTIYFENRYRAKDNTYRLLSWSVAPDRLSGLLYASAKDITEQRSQEAERRQLFDALNVTAINSKTDLRGTITEVNDLFCKISGYSKDELIGKDHRILNSGHQTKDFFKNMWGTISKGSVWTGDIKNKAKDGSYYWVRTVISPVKDFQNKISSYLSIRFDITAEKKAEEENRFILDALGLGIWRFNPVTQELYWDKSMYSLYEMNPSEITGHYQVWENALTLEAKAKVVEELGQALSGHKEFDTVFEINTKNKSKRHIGARGKVIRDSAGKPVMMFGVNWDVTKSKINEETLAAKERLLSTVLDTLPVAVFAKDIKNNFQWTIWNRHAENLLGLPAKDCLGKFDKDLYPKDQAEFFRQKDIEASKAIGVIDIPEEPATTVDGQVITMRTRKTVIRDANNEASILLGIAEDITERKKQQLELVAQTSQMKEAQAIAKIGSWRFDLQTNALAWTSEHYRIFEIEEPQTSERLSELCRERIHPEDLSFIDQHMGQAIKHGKDFVFDCRAVFDSGKRIKYLQVICKVSKDQLGTGLFLSGTCRDRSIEFEMQQMLQLERLKVAHNSKLASLGEMSAGIAHEINNPLAIIAGTVRALPRFASDPHQLKSRIETIVKASERIAKIVKSLRKFSRSDEKSQHAQHELCAIASEALVLTEAKSRRHSTPVSVNYRSKGQVVCDEIEIEQVLVNLINNAIDAVKSLAEKWVHIELFDEGSLVILRVQDSGPGISPEVKQKLFQPFFTTKPTGEGTGLGLSIVKGILDEHHATIEVMANDPHTSFEVRFPKAEGKKDAA